jgi:hypothetical protein
MPLVDDFRFVVIPMEPRFGKLGFGFVRSSIFSLQARQTRGVEYGVNYLGNQTGVRKCFLFFSISVGLHSTVEKSECLVSLGKAELKLISVGF